MSLIIDGIYLGGEKEADDKKWLKEHNVTIMIDMAAERKDVESTTPRCFMPCWDTDNKEHGNISKYFAKSYEILSILDGKRNVLVHCMEGKSRSATIVIAYLMEKYKLTVSQALHMVQIHRPIVQPNPYFMRQLLQLETRIVPLPVLTMRDFPERSAPIILG